MPIMPRRKWWRPWRRPVPISTTMTIRDFLDCAYAVLVEQWQSIGRDLLSAMEAVDESLGLGAPGQTVPTTAVPSASDNDRALQQLQTMMSKVKR